MNKEIDSLLARYFGGNTSGNDMQELEQWISTSTENQQYFDEMTSLYAKLGGSDAAVSTPDTQLAKDRFIAYISSQKAIIHTGEYKITRPSFYKSWMFRAAGIALFVMLSFATWKVFLADHDMVLVAQLNSKQEVLNDQTRITLSKNSKITYNSNYAKNDKIIRLEGEAEFKAGHLGKGKLQVIADETFIEDIGTVFAVTAYPDSHFVSVKVREGQVHFFTKKNKGLIISANETGVYDKQAETFKVLAQRLDSVAPGSMHVDFQGIILRDAIDIISNAYKVKINIADKSICNRKITVNFDGEDVNVVLQIIAQTLDLNLIKGDDGYLLSNKKARM